MCLLFVIVIKEKALKHVLYKANINNTPSNKISSVVLGIIGTFMWKINKQKNILLPSNKLLSRERKGGFALLDGSTKLGDSDKFDPDDGFDDSLLDTLGAGGIASDSR